MADADKKRSVPTGEVEGGAAKASRFRWAFRALWSSATPLIAILERQLAETVRACGLARAAAEGGASPAEAHRQMTAIEHGGDALRAELVAGLADAADAPFGREDVFRISRAIDEVLDNLRDFVRELDLYEVASTDKFTALLDAAASSLIDLHRAIQTITNDPHDTTHSALDSKESADEIRRLYEAELGRLFRGELTMEVMESRELLRRLDVIGLRQLLSRLR